MGVIQQYQRSDCVQALLDAGLPVEEPQTLSMLSRTLHQADLEHARYAAEAMRMKRAARQAERDLQMRQAVEAGRRLRAARLRLGLSQNDFWPVSQPAMSLHERGLQPMSHERAEYIAGVLGMTADDLLYGPVEAAAD